MIDGKKKTEWPIISL